MLELIFSIQNRKVLNFLKSLIPLFYFSLITSSCTVNQIVPSVDNLDQSDCYQHELYQYTLGDLPPALYTLRLDTSLTNHFSYSSLNIANAIGLLGMLDSLVILKQNLTIAPDLENIVKVLLLSQQIDRKINIANLEISSIASAMDCEEERADQIAVFLSNKEANLESRLTVAAIIVGATGAITSGLLLLNNVTNNSPEYVGLAAGITEAILGLRILMTNKKVKFNHPVNALKEIWEGQPVSSVFPPSIWYYINYFDPYNSNQLSIRERIIQNWLNFEQLDAENSSDKNDFINLFFGDGGRYNAEQLSNRANMHDQLESQINLMKQDLKLLAEELEKIF